MSLLSLRDIGKIYVSEGSVAVGIRGVDLDFDKGEFVAVTGQSGSGKSTLLNVISGMDSYEEGEMYVNGQPTSHYLQPDWEEYRKEYISFIFQDYNIIESFTVLQNVELALMNIDDKAERRRRALDLIDRVGLSKFIKQKGSKLSGGQKQRTVIARALAKDSPIILADEPTGNLDSETSKEIIRLLREVSRNKLLIVVTHNYEQVEEYATRHIRVFDGSVESDQMIRQPEPVPAIPEKKEKKAVNPHVQTLKNGFTLGTSIFTAKPKLSSFMCLLLLIGTLGLFMVTSLFGNANDLYEKHYMFTQIEGRVVITHQDGTPITEKELEELKKGMDIREIIRYDALLDTYNSSFSILIPELSYDYTPYLSCNFVYGKEYGTPDAGRYPNGTDEVFLYLPITYKQYFGSKNLEITSVKYANVNLAVSGVKYYYDNNKRPECLVTFDGFTLLTSRSYLSTNSGSVRKVINVNVDILGDTITLCSLESIVPSDAVEDGKAYIISKTLDVMKKQAEKKYGVKITDQYVDITLNCIKNDYSSSNFQSQVQKNVLIKSADLLENLELSSDLLNAIGTTSDVLLVNPAMYNRIAETALSESYSQASLFFKDNRTASKAVSLLKDMGYVAVPSDTTYQPGVLDTILVTVLSLGLAVALVLTVVFLAFFINLCSSRSIEAFKGDLAIMRSMGIPTAVIRIGMYARMLISLIPAYIIVAISAIVIFTSPILNEYFVFLYWWQYALIFIGMLALTLRVTHKQIKKLFGESVKKSLRGGSAE